MCPRTGGNHDQHVVGTIGQGVGVTTGVHILADSCLQDLSRGTPEVVRFVSWLSPPVTVLAVLLEHPRHDSREHCPAI